MGQEIANSLLIKYLNPIKVHIESTQQFYFGNSHAEIRMLAHLRVQTGTEEQGLEVSNTLTITVLLKHANLVVIFRVVESSVTGFKFKSLVESRQTQHVTGKS